MNYRRHLGKDSLFFSETQHDVVCRVLHHIGISTQVEQIRLQLDSAIHQHDVFLDENI